MADRTLTINHADGDSETYTINRDKFAGVREMSRGNVYPTIFDSSFSHSGVTYTKTDEETFSLVASSSSGKFNLTVLKPANGIRLGKHRIACDVTVNSGSISSIIGYYNDRDSDATAGSSEFFFNFVEGSNAIDFEIFDDGIGDPQIIIRVNSGSTCDISFSNFKVTHNYEEITVDRTAPDLVRTIIADGQTITIDTTREGVRTLTVDGTEITIDRTEEADFAGLLDQYSGAARAWSFQTLSRAMVGQPVVRVRRDSDNIEVDLTTPELTDGTLLAFTGAGSGYVRTIYGQDVNSINLNQSDPVKQRKIVDSGVLVTDGGLPAMAGGAYSYNFSTLTLSGAFSMLTLMGASSDQGLIGSENNNNRIRAFTNNLEVVNNLAGEINFVNLDRNPTNFNYDGTRALSALYRDGTNSMSLSVAGQTAASAPQTLAGDFRWNQILGYRDNIKPITGKFQEMIIWPSDIR